MDDDIMALYYETAELADAAPAATEETVAVIIRKSKFSRTPKRSAQISGFCIKRSVRKSTSAQH